MDPLFFLANLLLSVTVGTLMVALIAYMAYKIREVRKPKPKQPSVAADDAEPVFLRRFMPNGDHGKQRLALSKQ